MKTTKHFALVALLVLGATLCASTPARAQAWGIFPLSCVVGVDDPDYGASGQYAFSGMLAWGAVDQLGNHRYGFEGTLGLGCWDLTPGAYTSFAQHPWGA